METQEGYRKEPPSELPCGSSLRARLDRELEFSLQFKLRLI